jgi:hypothetical protein
MRKYRFAALIVTGLLVAANMAAPATAIPSPAPVRAQDAVEGEVVFSALQLPDHVRYAVTLLRPISASVTNVRVDVTLPAGAELAETLVTPNRSVFLGSDGNMLSWAAPGYEPGDPVDAFTFRLTRPLSAEASVRVSWEIDGQPRVDEVRAAPGVEVARAPAGEVTLRRGADNGPVGETGVRIGIDPDSNLDGVTLRLRKPGPEANPPAGIGSPWWCAMLAMEGLPAGASVLAVVPVRQPLPPGARVDLFIERAGAWEKIEDEGHATADGQFVAFNHPGGTVAAGVNTRFQAINTQTSGLTLAQARPILRVSVTGPTTVRVNSTATYTMRVSNVGNAAAQQVRAHIAGFAFRLTVPEVTSISGTGGFSQCTAFYPLLDPNDVSDGNNMFAECRSPSLAAGSSGEIRIVVNYALHPQQPLPVQTSLGGQAGSSSAASPPANSLQITICPASPSPCTPLPPSAPATPPVRRT